MTFEAIAIYRQTTMHGLRCDPELLGWTRLLDEWVVGLSRTHRAGPSDPVCWEAPGPALATLADAATRVRSFAYREPEIEATLPLEDGTLRIELQGRLYRVAADQYWPSAADCFIGLSRALQCRASAFSFPDAHEIDRYRCGNAEHPGALLLVQSPATGWEVSP